VGNKFGDILPKEVGSFKRIELKEPSPGLDREALYRNGEEEIFLLFSLSLNASDQPETMQTIFVETKQNAIGERRDISLKTTPAYIHLIGKNIVFFAWTRGLYCFSVDSKGASIKALECFLHYFPY